MVVLARVARRTWFLLNFFPTARNSLGRGGLAAFVYYFTKCKRRSVTFSCSHSELEGEI